MNELKLLCVDQLQIFVESLLTHTDERVERVQFAYTDFVCHSTATRYENRAQKVSLEF